MHLNFFRELDRAWEPAGSEPIDLKIIGSVAIMLQTDYDRPTKDSDVLEVTDLDEGVFLQLKKIAGKDTLFAKRNGIYLDVVPKTLPFLPADPCFVDCQANLENFHLKLLDLCDIIVSKFMSYRQRDQDDIRWLVRQRLIDSTQLAQRFRSAIQAMNERHASSAIECIENFHEVQRDFLRVPESEVRLPSWLKYV